MFGPGAQPDLRSAKQGDADVAAHIQFQSFFEEDDFQPIGHPGIGVKYVATLIKIVMDAFESFDDLHAENRLVVTIVTTVFAAGLRIVAGCRYDFFHDTLVQAIRFFGNAHQRLNAPGFIIDLLPNPRQRVRCRGHIAACR